MTGIVAALGAPSSGIQITISDTVVSDEIIGSGTATAVYTLQANGAITGSGVSGTWRNGTSSTGLEVRATQNSGSAVNGTLNSWLPLTSNQSWNITRSSYGTNTGQIKVEIRTTAGVILDTAFITLNATRTAA